ncbi:hypothetical protein D5S18_15140 [Nocardia panacis]|uniref:Uncharacterized protein n=1 Tax=Nocardia panacis TaxID=2340916 RepID=A0A3A4K3J4_9NOCA|nr:hypothetical protein [Nocardia panacis]RJO74783.1 hypothetical protein D5S18_15140 [Nocardia panacis]
MGFYDYRCMISGVSLRGAQAVAVALRPVQNGYRPLSLGVIGQYDRYGCVDGVLADHGTEVLADYFLARLRDGRFAVRAEWTGFTRATERLHIEELFQCFERNYDALDDRSAAVATFDGEPVFLALIAHAIWDAFADSDINTGDGAIDTAESHATPNDLAALLTDSPTAEIYGPHATTLAPQLRHLLAVDQFLAATTLRWSPQSDQTQRYAESPGTQHFSDDMRRLLTQAESDYADTPHLRAALKTYADSIHDLLDDA